MTAVLKLTVDWPSRCGPFSRQLHNNVENHTVFTIDLVTMDQEGFGHRNWTAIAEYQYFIRRYTLMWVLTIIERRCLLDIFLGFPRLNV